MVSFKVSGWRALVPLGLIMGGCTAPKTIVQKTVVEIKTDSTSSVDAILYEVDGGATTTISYQLFLRPHRGLEENEPLVIVDRFQPLKGESRPKVSWISANTVDFSIGSGRIFRYTNFWSHRQVDEFRRTIHIRLTTRTGFVE